MKAATDHLQPLDLPAQIGLYFPGMEGRLGVEVRLTGHVELYNIRASRHITHSTSGQDTPEAPIVRAERRRLRDWLATNIPIQWGKRVQRIVDNDEEVCVYFEDGTSAKGDILVGADGIKSVGKTSK